MRKTDREKMSILLSIVLASLTVLSASASASGIGEGSHAAFRSISNNDGLSNSSVTCIFQDRDSVMWFGTWDGLNRYDGMSMKQYRPKPGSPSAISHQVIRSISEDPDGRLWITTDYGINRLDKATEEFRAFFPKDIQTEIYEENLFSCGISRKGDVVAAYKGRNLHVFDKSIEDFIPISGCEGLKIASVLLFSNDGVLWAESSEKNIFRICIDGQRATDISAAFRLPDDTDTPVCDNLGRIWIQQGRRLLFFDTDNPAAGLQDSALCITGKLNALCSASGNILIGTSGGCFSLTDGQLCKIAVDIPVLSLLSGSQNILWIGTDGKGIQYSSPGSDFISSLPLPGSHPVRAITIDRHGRLYIGTKGGGLTIISPDGKQEKHDVGEGRSYNSVLSLANGGERIYIGTDGKGLRYYDLSARNIRVLNFSGHEEGKHIRSVYSIVQDSSCLWAGTSGEGLFRISLDCNGAVADVKRYVHSDKDSAGISSNIIYDIVNDGEWLWLATRGGGLNHFCKKTGKSVIFKTMTGGGNDSPAYTVCSNDLISLLKDSSGNLWTGTSSGLSMMHIDSTGKYVFRHFDESTGLPNTNIHSIVEDSGHTVWASTSNGISGIQPDAPDCISLFYGDGLMSNEYSDGAGYADKESGRLFFGNAEGIDIISPELLPDNGWSPNLLLRHIMIDKTPCGSIDSSIVAGYRTSSIGFDFSIPDYLDGQKCSLAYFLVRGKGASAEAMTVEDWINIRSGRTIVLSQLSPGHYTLSVRCSNSRQIWSAPQKYHITIKYPALLKPWMIALYIAGAVILAFLLVRLVRTRRAMRAELETERKMYRQTIGLMALRNAEASHGQANEDVSIPGYDTEIWDKSEKDFMRKVMDAIEKNFGNEDYNQDALAADIAVSRVQLYRKMKQILSTTPGDFIRRFRMRKAEQMLLETRMTVQEILYDCGFRNKAYFYREFNRLHNCSPKDFRERHKQNG